MQLKQMLENLWNSSEFKTWKKSNSDFYLAHVFVMRDEANKGTYQIGYYNSKKDKMISFIISEKDIKQTPEQEVMKANQKIQELNPSEIKTSIEKALSTAKKCKEENYKNEIVVKSFFIIQKINELTLFNITYLTKTLKAINIRVNSVNGKVVKHTSGVIAQFSQ